MTENEDENVGLKRKVYLSREIARAVVGFPKSDEITRKVVPVAINAIRMFDLRHYAMDEWKKFFEDGMADETMRALYFECLSQGVIEGTKWCNNNHEQPKTCSCQEVLKVVLGLVPATAPLSELGEEA